MKRSSVHVSSPAGAGRRGKGGPGRQHAWHALFADTEQPGSRRKRGPYACLAAALSACLCLPLHAQASSFNGSVALSSQLIDRGLAITPVAPILQGAVSWTTASGWVWGLSGGTQLRSTGHGSEALVQAGHYWALSGEWRMQTDLAYYAYPGNARAHAFDRTEGNVSWLYRDVLSFGLSAIVLAHGGDRQPRGAADLDVHWPLPGQFALSAGVGVAQPLSAPLYYGMPAYGVYDAYGYYYGGRYYPYQRQRTGSYYGYGHLGVAWTHGGWRVELDRVATDPSQRDMAAAPWVATIAWSF